MDLGENLELGGEKGKKLTELTKRFRKLLRNKDLNYESEISYEISYNPQLKNYQAEINPVNQYFKLEDYFNNVLGGEEFAKSAFDIGIVYINLKN